MAETAYYDHDGVQVTASRFIVNGQTYPIGQITSVKVSPVPVRTGCTGTLVMVGLFVAIGGLVALGASLFGATDLDSIGGPVSALVGGCLIALLGWFLSKQNTSRYAVTVTTAAGEQRVLQSPEVDVPQAIVNAINEALAARG